MKKKMLVLLLSIMTIVSVGTMTTLTAHAEQVNLYANQTSSSTRLVPTLGTKATVYNSASSSHRVWGIIKYNSGLSTVEDYSKLVGVGKTENFNSASKFTSKMNWMLTLDPYGTNTKNCTADGFLYAR